ncbi:MAG: GerMN domain-containing protein [Oscillospiraceae bacterium]|nr:GerMN domain-containing protein [Oscillospiraceae bacterium]
MKKLVLIICFTIIVSLLFGCVFRQNSEQPAASSGAGASPSASAGLEVPKVVDYFPARENVRYVYQGDGNEYASYDVYTDYSSTSKIQQRINNGGTELVQVIELSNGKAACVFSREECYYRENFLDKTDGSEEILMLEPITAGTSWKLNDGSVRTINGIDVGIDTPSGSYSAVAVETIYADGGSMTDYYARGIGLVKTVSKGEGYTVNSSLSEIQENAEFSQSVRFYYPGENDVVLYFRDRELSFKTNDVTCSVIESAYKERFENQPGRVFPENADINSLYLNDDGTVCLDLDKDFINEMNTGAAGEMLILQCLANTFGSYYGSDKLILTIDNGLYESGHIRLEKGQVLSVKTEGSAEIS